MKPEMGATQEWILGIDLGSGGPKVAVVALDGEVMGTGFRGVTVDVGTDGRATQDANEWSRALAKAVREAVTSADVAPSGLHSIGVTGQWGSTVPVGVDGEPAGPVLMWADTRGRKYMPDVIGGPLSVDGFAPHKVLPWVRITGGAPSPNGADPTGHSLLLQHELADIGARCRWLMEPVDYIAFRLTGRAAATPASMIPSWLTDNRIGAQHGYLQTLVKRARRNPRLLPELLPTGSVQGELQKDVADELGLRPGVPVMTGVPDLHAGIIASGTVQPYQTHMAISTTAWLSSRVPFKKTDILHLIATVPGLDAQYPLVANNLDTGGAALSWLREQVIAPNDGLLGGGSGIGAMGAAALRDEPTFQAMLDLAGTVPAGSEGVLFAPWLSGERSPVEDKDIRATWLNISFRTNRAALIRSVMEGVSLNVRWLFGYYEKFLGRRVPSLRIMGGGAQSSLWCSIQASVLDRRVEQVADPMHAQLRGIALWSRVCLGELTLPQAAALVPVSETFEPEPGDAQVYREAFDEYRRIYSTVKRTYRRLNHAKDA